MPVKISCITGGKLLSIGSQILYACQWLKIDFYWSIHGSHKNKLLSFRIQELWVPTAILKTDNMGSPLVSFKMQDMWNIKRNMNGYQFNNLKIPETREMKSIWVLRRLTAIFLSHSGSTSIITGIIWTPLDISYIMDPKSNGRHLIFPL